MGDTTTPNPENSEPENTEAADDNQELVSNIFVKYVVLYIFDHLYQ